MYAMQRLLLLAYVAASTVAVCAENPDTAMLNRVQTHMAETLSRLPNYTCLQTIERMERRAPSRRFSLIDMVRLEVALVRGKELFSWPGKHKFEDTEIGEMVSGGAIGNGNFGLHAKALFQSRSAEFTYAGERAREDKRALRWDYRVPLARSAYVLRNGSKEALTAYHGSFWVDPDSLDVTRLEMRADDISRELQISDAQDAVEYVRAPIGPRTFLLPKSSEMILTDLTGSESRNRTRFSGCREYLGESKLIFSDPVEDSRPKQVTREFDLPAGFRIDASVETPLKTEETAVGDPFTMRLQKDVKRGDEILVPKGALLHGHVTLFRPQNTAPASYAIGLRVGEIEFKGAKGKARLVLEHVVAMNALARYPSGANAFSESAVRGVSSTVATIGNVFFMKGPNFNLNRGVRMLWRSEDLNAEDKQ
jgi:hypothetical protein